MATHLLSYDLTDGIETELCDIRDRLSALESTVYTPMPLEAVPSRQERLNAAQDAIRTATDIYIDLGVIDADVITTSIARPLIEERIAAAEREGRI